MKKATDKLKNNYIVIQSWMVRELGLKGNRLTVYAIVYGFSQTEKQACTCGVEYLQAWTNSSKQGVLNTLESLVNDGFIERIKDFGGDKRKTAYRIIGQQSLPISTEKKGKESLPKCKEKGQQTLPNFIEDNVDNSKIGQQSLPKSGEIGKESLPKNRSTFFRASLENIYNNTTDFQTDKSVCQSVNAHAREDETDGQTEKEFYLDCIRSHLDKLDDPYKADYSERLENIATELARWETVKVNGVDLPTTEILKSTLDLFRDPEQLRNALFAGCKEGVKRKFNYTVAALYNAARGF